MPKIVFVEPKAAEEHIFAQFKLPRLGVIILGTMMKERGWDVEIIIESLAPIVMDESVAGRHRGHIRHHQHRRQCLCTRR